MIFEIQERLPHEVAELICLKCFRRWIGVYPHDLPLKELSCKCGQKGCVIKTGQSIGDYEEVIL